MMMMGRTMIETEEYDGAPEIRDAGVRRSDSETLSAIRLSGRFSFVYFSLFSSPRLQDGFRNKKER
jgi:hypothetical protein